MRSSARALALLAVWGLAAGPRPTVAQETHALIVSGLGGSPDFRDRFLGWATALRAGLVERNGLSPERITVLSEDPSATPTVSKGRSTKENVLGALADLATHMAAADRLLIVLIGHGTASGNEARFNLPGPDLAPADLSAALSVFATQPVAVVLTGSASGGFVEPLKGPGRVVVSATRSSREGNATEFPRFFVEALSTEGPDLDKDGRISLLEAYEYARSEVARFYEAENEILTEHAMIDGDGDGKGSYEASADTPDGQLAAAFMLAGPTRTTMETDDPVLARLYQERADIQERIDKLRGIRASLSEDEYAVRLEGMLLELALKAREIRAREGGGG